MAKPACRAAQASAPRHLRAHFGRVSPRHDRPLVPAIRVSESLDARVESISILLTCIVWNFFASSRIILPGVGLEVDMLRSSGLRLGICAAALALIIAPIISTGTDARGGHGGGGGGHGGG